MTLGAILVLIGLSMAWSGYYMEWKMRNLLRARQYGYHIVFRKIWWVPTVIGGFLLITLQ